jgi:hypothetical protein
VPGCSAALAMDLVRTGKTSELTQVPIVKIDRSSRKTDIDSLQKETSVKVSRKAEGSGCGFSSHARK